MIAVAVLLGGVWRFVDGLSRDTTGIPTGVRNAVSFVIVLWATSIAGIPYVDMAVVSLVSAASVMVGNTKWQNAVWQAARFGAPAAIASAPYLCGGEVSAVVFVALCSAAGMGYTVLGTVDAKLPRWWLFDGFEAYARIPLGAAVLGGPSILQHGSTTWDSWLQSVLYIIK